MQNSLELANAQSLNHKRLLHLSETLAKSQLIPRALQRQPNDVLVILLMAEELKIPPMQALSGINVIQGKPVISPQLMLALIRSRIPLSYVSIKEGDLACECTMARDKNDLGQAYTASWDLQRAQDMGLAAKDNWKKQAQTMLKWRAVGDAARVIFPDILMGMYLPDEFQDGSLHIDEHGELIPQVPQKQNTLETPTIPTIEVASHWPQAMNLLMKLKQQRSAENLEEIKKELLFTKREDFEKLPEEQQLAMIDYLLQQCGD